MQETLTSIRTRVRFKLFTNLTKEEYIENLKKYINDNPDQFTGRINSEISTIYVKNDNQNYWKPNLSLSLNEEDKTTVIRGVFGPSSSVWTFYMFMYFLLSVALMVFGSMYFLEKEIKTNNYPWAATASIITIVLLLGNYLVSQIGQRLSQKEMKLLRQFAEESTYPHAKENPTLEV